jgi:hypothetical protein
VSSAIDDPDNCFNKLQLSWRMLRNHRDSDLYWFFEDDSASLSKNSGTITELLLLLLMELDMSRLSVAGKLALLENTGKILN